MSIDPKQVRKRLQDITIIRNSQGKLDRNSDDAKERERIIYLFVYCLKEEISNIRTGIVKSKIAWKSPVINSFYSKSALMIEAAQRIAWELFPKQFSQETQEYVLGIENDPFYDNHEQHLLSDTLKLSIEVQKASAEKLYRALLRNMRSCYLIKDPQESPVITRLQQ